MREVLGEIARFRAEGSRFAVARVVQVEGSGPREPGAAMVVSEDGRVVGSVSGGCVEGAVVEESLALIASGRSKLVRFGYSDDEAFAVGLTCGGIISIFCSPELPGIFDAFSERVVASTPCALATVIGVAMNEETEHLEGRGGANACIIDGRPLEQMTRLGATILVDPNGTYLGTLGDDQLDEFVARDGVGVIASGHSTIRHYGKKGEEAGEEISIFYESFAPPPKLFVFGAVDFTAALVRVAKVLGYEVTVCDARAPFATRARFPEADHVEVDWPHRLLERVGNQLGERDAICVLTHDPKFDQPAIIAALKTQVGYIGAMGSRRTHRERTQRLVEAGVSERDLERICSPIGLDLGARSPEETSIAICAEIISQQTGHSPLSLRDSDGPIHGRVNASKIA